MTGARAYITERSRVSMAIGTTIGAMISVILGTTVVLGAYHSLKSDIETAQATATAAVEKANEVKGDVEKMFTVIRQDLHEIRADVKVLLQQQNR